jgi:hypothetical protein
MTDDFDARVAMAAQSGLGVITLDGEPVARIEDTIITGGRVASPKNVRFAARWFVQVSSSDLEPFEDLYVDRRDETLWAAVPSDPLLLQVPTESTAERSAVIGAHIAFLSPAGTLAALQNSRAAHAQRAERLAEDERRFRSKQRQQVIRLDGPTLQQAAAFIENECGGSITLGSYDDIVVSVPERITVPDGDWATNVRERDLHKEALRMARALVYGAPVVRAALAHRAGDKAKSKPLAAYLPDRPPSLGGGDA